MDRYITGAVGNPNAISGNDIEKLKQKRDSSMERHALLKESMVPQLRKTQGASPMIFLASERICKSSKTCKQS